MTNIINLFPVAPVPASPDDEAVRRLQKISGLLSGLELTAVPTPGEMTRALRTLSAANSCIRIVLEDLRDAPNIGQLIDQSERLLGMIERTRTQVAGLNPNARLRAGR